MADGRTGSVMSAGQQQLTERDPAPRQGRPCDGDGLVHPIVIAVGAGAKGSDAKRAIRRLKERVGAVLVGTRPAVDAGIIEREQMVGQTGIRCVDADIYLAIGISGSSQHRSSLKRVGTLIAINRDRRAPIMSEADVAIAADVEPAVETIVRALDAIEREGGVVRAPDMAQKLVACCVAMAHSARSQE